MTMFEIGADRWPGISKLIEESGEVLQVCGKLIGAQGEVEHWDGTNLRDKMNEELGDLLAAVKFVIAYCELDGDKIHERGEEKFRKFEEWHRRHTTVRDAP